MNVTLPRAELNAVLALARELALMMDADSNSDEEHYLEVRLLRAVERVEQHVRADSSADVAPCGVPEEEGGA